MVVFLQVGASMMDPNHFLMIVLSRFELFHIFSSADCRKRYREANKVSSGSTHSLLTLQKQIWYNWYDTVSYFYHPSVIFPCILCGESHCDPDWDAYFGCDIKILWIHVMMCFLRCRLFYNYSYNNRRSKFCLACSLIKGQSVCLTGCGAAEQHTGWRDVTPHHYGYR